MTPHDFIAKWRGVELKERSASQSHFNDLCALLGVPDPITADPKGEWFTFEKGAGKTTGGEGWADVWRRECFAWEYKGPRKDLDRAFAQLQQYAIALENPPLLIVSDMTRFRIHTNWTNSVQEVHAFDLEDLADAAARELLAAAFLDPERLRPRKTRQLLTEQAAVRFATLAQRLRERGHDAQAVAHFVNRLVFCMFAEDVGLLPGHMFRRMLEHCQARPADFEGHACTLFGAMRAGGMVGFESVAWFNGGLFDDDAALALDRADVADLLETARLDWSDIDPSILGTLFERGLDPAKRSQLGAHYTDRDKIMQIVDPVIVEPLLAEWAAVRGRIEARLASAPQATQERLLRGAELAARTKAINEAEGLHRAFLERLAAFRVLDPACGSGNFLYLALLALKGIEHRVNLEGEALGLPRGFPQVGPDCVLGIELNPFAAELARVSVWIGEIQWMRRNGFEAARNPILRPLATIECRDALLNLDGTETSWPSADAIIGNPPFLGAKLMRRGLGADETTRIRAAFEGKLPGFTDLVCYWFEKARAKIVAGDCVRAGLVATNSIARNTNLPVLRRIADDLAITEAWSDEPWVVNGAAVRVSIVCFAQEDQASAVRRLNGHAVERIHANLTAGIDVSRPASLPGNRGQSLLGIQKSGPLDVPGKVARAWMALPTNPNGRSNASVLRPYWNGDDLTGQPRDVWFIDLPRGLSEGEAALFETPFEYLASSLYDPAKPNLGTLREARAGARDQHARDRWWEPYWPRPEMRQRIAPLSRYLVTPETAEHRLFVWLRPPILPDKNLIVIPRDDDTTFGILQSRFHEVWATTFGNRMGKGNQRRYNNQTTFETFPFPEGLTPNIPAVDYAADPRAQAIATAAATLNERRETWLSPSELVRRAPEVAAGYPDRLLPVDEAAAKELRRRTLTSLYNLRPTWLAHAHAALDAAVAAAYGWEGEWKAGMSDATILACLFALNQDGSGQAPSPTAVSATTDAEAPRDADPPGGP